MNREKKRRKYIMEKASYLECGRTPLQEAIYTKDYDEAKRLIWNGANVVQRTLRNASSLHLACQNITYDKQLVELLLVNGCFPDPNALDAACSAGHLELVRVMKTYGVQLQDRNFSGWNGFSYAVEEFHARIIYFLMHHYNITEEMKSSLPFLNMKKMAVEESPGLDYGFIKSCTTRTKYFPRWTCAQWCGIIDTYFVSTESMISLPHNIEMHEALTPHMIHFRETRKRVHAWNGVMVKMTKTGFISRDVGRIIGWWLWQTRFECIPLNGEVIMLES